MFEDLTQKLDVVLRKLRGQGRLTAENVGESLLEVRQALLEADVNLQVARDFVARVQEKALGQDVLGSLQPGQHVVKIVHEEIVALLGGQTAELNLTGVYPAVVLLAGLQGSGKTTFAAKLAGHLLRKGRKPLLVAADIYRPAAIDQLQILGGQVGVPVFARPDEKNVPRIVEQARAEAKQTLRDTLLVDTAGRLHIDDELMRELEAICKAVPPTETLLVVDAMTGQEAVHVAQEFDARLGLTGVVLTKLDGDARGGAALSLRAVLGKPIKFVGVGESLDDLEPFHPDRMAQRILGMGDVLTLIEKAQETYDEAQALELEKKMRRQSLTLEDFLQQLESIQRMGPLDKLLGMMPGMTPAMLKDARIEPRQVNRVRGIVHSMTQQERRNPNVIDGSRRRRIARGSGTSVQEVNLLLKQFDQMKRMMKAVSTKPAAAARQVVTGGMGARYGGKRKHRKH
jgi:signal recognition particle subunit SRP54